MKALVKRNATESYEYVEVPVPRPKEGELLVQVRKVALCGTDIQKYKWNDGNFSTRVCEFVGAARSDCVLCMCCHSCQASC